ncbi:accessory Sec system S-layer assembly protein [Bacillus sp. FJAT-45037]|uniref:accessory Sec system S-layer assembly protein n=1 Tax=Bacillus sp. FJAT-45037 TaxID=2011007 RepID=UPI000C248CEB|nr:accessory Sec system S-layer assembly protein [Bacillus sp. FJAT-45037]
MIPFFKKKNQQKPEIQGIESYMTADVTTKAVEADITTTLSISPSWQLAKEDMYVYQFLNQECAPLKSNQLSLSGINLERSEQGYTVTAFIRNSLDRSIKLNKTTLVLLNPENQTLAKKEFPLEKVGEIPARSSRPWIFFFESDLALERSLPEKDWKLAFALKPNRTKHALELSESWEASLSNQEKESLATFIQTLEPLKSGEVNFTGLQAKKQEQGNLVITALVRNGSNKKINLEQLPLVLEDASGEIVAKGTFKLGDFYVNPNTSKPWSFIYPSHMQTKENIDLTKWKIYPPATK